MMVWLAVLGFEFDIIDPPELITYADTLAGFLSRAAARSPDQKPSG